MFRVGVKTIYSFICLPKVCCSAVVCVNNLPTVTHRPSPWRAGVIFPPPARPSPPGRYDIRIDGLGLDYLVSEVANTTLKEPKVGQVPATGVLQEYLLKGQPQESIGKWPNDSRMDNCDVMCVYACASVGGWAIPSPNSPHPLAVDSSGRDLWTPPPRPPLLRRSTSRWWRSTHRGRSSTSRRRRRPACPPTATTFSWRGAPRPGNRLLCDLISPRDQGGAGPVINHSKTPT